MRSSISLFLTICVTVSASAPTPHITSVSSLPGNEVLLGKELLVPEYVVNSPNVVSVPDNCPTGQELINGQCRDIWRTAAASEVDTANVITVPPNCPDGQQFINGQCREITPKIKTIDRPPFDQNVATVLENCPSGHQPVSGVCRETRNKVVVAEIPAVDDKNVRHLGVPDKCPSVQHLVNGQCRFMFSEESLIDRLDSDGKNIIVASENCPAGQQVINGQCRDIWRNMYAEPSKNRVAGSDITEMVKTLQEIRFKGLDIGILLKHIVQVPNQCPDGYKPDSVGVCREIWKKISK